MDKFYFQLDYPEFQIIDVIPCPVFTETKEDKYVFGFIIFDETVYPFTTYVDINLSPEIIVKWVYKAAMHAMLPDDYDNVTSFTEDAKHDEFKLKLLEWAKNLKN